MSQYLVAIRPPNNICPSAAAMGRDIDTLNVGAGLTAGSASRPLLK